MGLGRALALYGLAVLPIVMRAQAGPVIATGDMRNTMQQGQLAGLIGLDSIALPGYHGLGPLEYLRGELLLLDGQVYCATAITDSTMQVSICSEAHAPFFVHQRVEHWAPLQLPDSITDLLGLDAFLTAHFGMEAAPFAFRLTGHFSTVDVHVLDVPPGTAIQGPQDAHRHNRHFHLSEAEAEALGFFSTRHKTVFTHHDTHIHVHAITPARDWMGHVEELRFEAGKVRLWVGR